MLLCPIRSLVEILDDRVFFLGRTGPAGTQPGVAPRDPLGALMGEMEWVVVMNGNNDISFILGKHQVIQRLDAAPFGGADDHRTNGIRFPDDAQRGQHRIPPLL